MISNARNGTFQTLAFQQDKLYLLSLSENANNVSTENEKASSSMNATNKRKRVHDVSSKLWHCRLGHILRGRIERLIKKSILPLLEFSDLEQCILHKRKVCKKNKERCQTKRRIFRNNPHRHLWSFSYKEYVWL